MTTADTARPTTIHTAQQPYGGVLDTIKTERGERKDPGCYLQLVAEPQEWGSLPGIRAALMLFRKGLGGFCKRLACRAGKTTTDQSISSSPSGKSVVHFLAAARPSCLSEKSLCAFTKASRAARSRSEEHTSELQSLRHLVCRLLL